MDCNSKIFQYDVNVFVSVPDGIKWVDYNTDPVTRVEVLDRKARIPDEYLETAGTKLMWFCVDDQTRFLHSIYVEKRPVPPDHATTPTETITFATLVEKVNNLIDEAEEAIETIEEKMSRMVLYLSQSSNVYHLRNAQGSEVSFDELLTMCRTESIYVVILYGNSKLRPQYVSTNEIHADGEDRDSLGAMFLRMVMTPTSLYYSVARLKDEPEFISMKSDKLSKPSTGIEVGKYFRVASMDSEGNPVLEAVDLPIFGQGVFGVLRISTNHGFQTEDGYLMGIERTLAQYRSNLRNSVISKGTLENIGDDFVERHTVEKEWALKGTITNTEPLNVDLSGCTELFIYSTCEGTSSVVLNANINGNLYGLITPAVSGTRSGIYKFVDGMFGIEPVLSRYGVTQTDINGNASGLFIPDKVIADISSFSFSRSGVTSCNIEIYAR